MILQHQELITQCFILPKPFCASEGLTFSSHAAVISAFGRELTRTVRVPVEFHRYLIDAQDKRNQADYNIDSSITESQATELISRAEEFLQLAQSMLGLPPT